MKKKIAIIGHFGEDKDFFDGQTVKTKILYDELRVSTDWDIQKIDTYWKRENPIKLLVSTVGAMIWRKDTIVLLSINGMKTMFPILSFFSKIWSVRVFHDVIGGNLDKHIETYPKFKKYLNSFNKNWVETEVLQKALVEKGITNCEVIPNFKRLNIVNTEEFPTEYNKPYRFCTFSRVMKEKGIEEAINAIEKINSEAGTLICCLDIYGVVDNSYKQRFEEILSTTSEYVKYCGVVPYNQSVKTIKNYYGLLFPTFWDGEGFPGTIIDAFSAGVPVIASDWNSNKEIIKHGENGFIFPNKKISSLKDGITRLICDTELAFKMKKECLLCASKYQPDIHIKHIVDELERLE